VLLVAPPPPPPPLPPLRLPGEQQQEQQLVRPLAAGQPQSLPPCHSLLLAVLPVLQALPLQPSAWQQRLPHQLQLRLPAAHG
jgi:hypothetical protein